LKALGLWNAVFEDKTAPSDVNKNMVHPFNAEGLTKIAPNFEVINQKVFSIISLSLTEECKTACNFEKNVQEDDSRQAWKYLQDAFSGQKIVVCGSGGVVKYIQMRYENSNLKGFVDGTIGPADADAAINTLTLVDALLLTLPVTMITALGSSYWDWLDGLDCADDFVPGTHTYMNDFLYKEMVFEIWAQILASVTGIILAVFYYLLRPSCSKNFGVWWQRGKFVLLYSFVATTICVVFVLLHASRNLNGRFVNSSGRYCSPSAQESPVTYQTIWGGYVWFGFALVLALIAML